MAHTRAADDFQAIRARMKELRCERERAVVTETDGGLVQRVCRGDTDNEIVICLRRLRNQIGLPL